MKCEKAREILMTDYLDGEMDEALVRVIKTHLAQCPACRQLAARLEQTLQKPFAGVSEIKAPRQVWLNIQSQLLERQNRPIPGIARAAADFLGWFLRAENLSILVPVTALFLFFVMSPALRNPLAPYSRIGDYLLDQAGILSTQETSDLTSENHSFGTVIEEYFM